MIIRTISYILDRLFAVGGACLFSQVPLYIAYYQQQLVGRVDELNRYVTALQSTAQYSGKSLPNYIQKFIQSTDGDFHAQGVLMQGMVDRFHGLQEALSKLLSSPVYSKPIVFFQYFDKEIAASTFQSFSPGIPMSLEGGIYAALGLFFGLGLFGMIRLLFNYFKKISCNNVERSV